MSKKKNRAVLFIIEYKRWCYNTDDFIWYPLKNLRPSPTLEKAKSSLDKYMAGRDRYRSKPDDYRIASYVSRGQAVIARKASIE